MAIRLPVANLRMLLNTATATTTRLDGTSDAVAAAFIACKAGTITAVGVWWSAKTGTPGTYRLGLEGAAASRAPDGTYKASGAAHVDVTNPAVGFNWYTLGTSATVAQGESVMVTVRYGSGTVDGTNYVDVNYAISIPQGTGTPYALSNTGSWVATSALYPILCIKYSDGTIQGLGIDLLTNNNSWTSASNPLYRGTIWTPDFDCICDEIAWLIRTGDTVDYDILILDNSNNVLWSYSLDSSAMWSRNSQVDLGCIPTGGIALTSGSSYRFVLKPTTGNSPTTFVDARFKDGDAIEAVFGPLRGTVGTSGLAWTDYNSAINGFKMYPVVPIVTGISGGGTSGIATLVGGSLVR